MACWAAGFGGSRVRPAGPYAKFVQVRPSLAGRGQVARPSRAAGWVGVEAGRWAWARLLEDSLCQP